MTFEQRVAAYIESEQLLSPGAKVIVGLSGGADSTALLAVLSRLGYDCRAVHCNFGLRGREADADMAHSQWLAAKIDVPFECVEFYVPGYIATHGGSVEMACRDLRYDYFEQRRVALNAEAIAVGHHVEDNVETFFLNLFRGTGIKGLRAMLPKRGCIVRPLLAETRRDIEQYVIDRGLTYVTDSSNALNDYKRNRIRNIVLPMIEEQFPGAMASIGRTINNLRADDRLIEQFLRSDSTPLELASPEVLRRKLGALGFNSSQCADIRQAVSGATFTSDTHRLDILPGGRYCISEIDATPQRPHLTGKVYAKPANFKPEPGVLYMDAKALDDARWELRPWREGDRIRPFGMSKGSKPVSDLLASVGIAASMRRQCHVLTRNDKIVWVVGVRTSSHFPITDKTNEIIEIRHETN